MEQGKQTQNQQILKSNFDTELEQQSYIDKEIDKIINNKKTTYRDDGKTIKEIDEYNENKKLIKKTFLTPTELLKKQKTFE